jgi:hypothetical protein
MQTDAASESAQASLQPSKLQQLAHACHLGACNPHGIIRSLAEAMSEVPPGKARESVELKMIIGQISFLLGESLGPTAETLRAFQQLEKAQTGGERGEKPSGTEGR